MLKLFSRLFVVLLAITMFLLQIAATGNAQDSALAIAGVVAAVSPFVIQVLKNYFHLSWDGPKMLAAASVVALAIALAALQVTGNLNLNDPMSLVGTIATAFALQQIVFQALKDSSKVGPYLK